MPRAKRPEIYTIAPNVAFTDALAQGLMAQGLVTSGAGDPLALARTRIILPNRRAVRALTEAFVRAADGGLLLPRMIPLGDIDDNGDGATLGGFAAGLDIDAGMPPAIDPLRRRLLLAQMLRRWRQTQGLTTNVVEALRLADQLGKTLDTVLREGISPSALDLSLADDLAKHWAVTAEFFRLMLDLWPAILAAEPASETALYQNRQLALLIQSWQQSPPGERIIVAGISMTNTQQAAFLRAVVDLPNGLMVLAGLDGAMPEAEWDALICPATEPGRSLEEHPQYALKLLLDRLGIARDEVRDWPTPNLPASPPERMAAVARALAPAAFTGDWRGLLVGTEAFAGVRVVEAGDLDSEAQAIALAMRQNLEIPGATAALITPNRGLARRVAAHCARWGIEVDDSAGSALRVTPPGTLALAIVEAAAQHFAPVALLAVLKHPLVNPFGDRAAWLENVRRLDIAFRGVRPAPGLDGVGAHIDAYDREHDRALLSSWWAHVAGLLQPLEYLFVAPRVHLPELIKVVNIVGSAMSPDQLWRGPAGRLLGELLAKLQAHGTELEAFEPLDAPALLAAFLDEAVVRPVYGKHPRLHIWGLIEARLQSADLLILGGLNEASWPAVMSPDPWLAPKLRRELQLPGLEAAIGLSAHDFSAALGAKSVLLTRAKRDSGGQTVASRFLLRLQTLAGDALQTDARLLALAQAIDDAGPPVPAKRPDYAPPASMRPRLLSVTAVEKLRADPFSFYAQTILRLRVLDPLDADPTAAERGTSLHKVLEDWLRGGDSDPARLQQLAEAELQRWAGHPLMRTLWAPRVRRMMDWVTEEMRDWEAEGWQPIKAEARGRYEFANGITLTGVADRIDRNPQGELAIVDYKTGTVPSSAQVTTGFALQMGLLGALAQRGALDGVPSATVTALRYWKLGGGKDAGKASDPLSSNRKALIETGAHIDATLALFIRLCDDYLLGTTGFTAKLHPDHAAKYRDYDHLARVAEWLGKPELQP